jgi:peptidoglycan hydrolase-like protein with peptidoglycan-binding domain
LKVERLLEGVGLLDTRPTEGPTGYYGTRLEEAIKGFQKQNGLSVDGWLAPGGETIRALKRAVPAGSFIENKPRWDEEGTPPIVPPRRSKDGPGFLDRPRVATTGSLADDLALLGLLLGSAVYSGMSRRDKRKEEGVGRTVPAGNVPSGPPPFPAEPPEGPKEAGKEEVQPASPLPDVGGLGTPIRLPEMPNVLIFPAEEQDPKDNIQERKGGSLTKAELDELRDRILAANPGWEHSKGGRDRESGEEKKERHVPGPGRRWDDVHTLGGYFDLSFKTPSGRFVHVQTVDVYVNGKPTKRELDNAERLRRLLPSGHSIILVPKRWQMKQGKTP